MASVVADMTMSLDGFIADPADNVGPLFDWYQAGPITYTFPGDGRTAEVSEASAEQLDGFVSQLGALICGRRLFDLTNGWNGNHPVGTPVFVVTHTIPENWTHENAPFTFVTNGVESAVTQARQAAGEKLVVVASADIAQQCLNSGLLDAIRVNLAPVLLGTGIPWFANLAETPMLLDDPEVIEGARVTHLTYRVRKP